MVKMRRLPEDDYMHEPETASNFNESRYYNWFDHQAGTGGWVRMGNRVNEGYAELTVCLYLPDGSVGFMFKRPKIETNAEHNAGGLRFEVLKPYEEHRITFDGKVCVLTNPREMAEPREAFAQNPHVPCTIDLHLTNVGPAQGGEPEWEEGEQKPDLDPEKMFARGHTEQHMRSVGTVTVGDQTFDITDGLGLRDHSWGPRYWQNIWWYRWLTVNLGEDLGFAVTIAGDEAGQARRARLPLRQAALRRRPLGAGAQRRAELRLRRRLVPAEEPHHRHHRRPHLRGRPATCGPTSRCATAVTTWSRASPRA